MTAEYFAESTKYYRRNELFNVLFSLASNAIYVEDRISVLKANQYHPLSSLLESDMTPLRLGIDSKSKSFSGLDYGSRSYSSSPTPCDVIHLDRDPFDCPS